MRMGGPYPWRRKPAAGTPIDREAAISEGLLAYFPFWEQAGTVATDAASGVPASMQPPGGWGLEASTGMLLDATGCYAQTGPLPAAFDLPYPISLMLWLRPLQAPSTAVQAAYFNATSAGGGSSGFLLGYSGSPYWQYLAGGSIETSTTPVAYGVDVVLGLTVGPTSQALYVGGRPAYQTALSLGTPAYSSPFINFGASSSIGARNPGLLIYAFGLWARGLSGGEHARLAADPTAPFGAPPWAVPHGSYYPWLFDGEA